MANPTWNPFTGSHLALADRIRRSAFGLAMLVVLVIGGISLALSLQEIPAQDKEAHTTALSIIGERLSSDVANRLGNLEALSRSSLVWTALTDSTGRDAYLRPFLADHDRQSENGDLLLLDYRGRLMAGNLHLHLSDRQLQEAIAAVLEASHPKYVVQADPPLLLAAYPVQFPYTRDAIGVLVGVYDLAGIFRKDIAGLDGNHGITLYHAEKAIAQFPPDTSMRHTPVQFQLRLPGGDKGLELSLELYSTDYDDWLKPILTHLIIYQVVGFAFAILVWHIAGRVATSLTRRLKELADACAGVAAGQPFMLAADPANDEIALLSRTLRQAILAHEEIQANLERLVEQKTQALNESLERYRQSFEANTAVKLIVDSQSGRIFDANSAAACYYGYAKDDLLTRRISDIDCQPPETIAAVTGAAATGRKPHFLSRHRLASGEIRDVEVHSSLVLVGGKPYLHSIVHDVTERKRLEAELEGYRQDLEQLVAKRTTELMAANRELQGFTYAASHDMKAPLGRINSFSALLEKHYRDRLDGDGIMFIDLIRRNATRMTALLEDLLEHAQIEQQTLVLEAVHLQTAVQAVLAEQAEDIRESGAVLRLDLPDATVRVNPHGLAQILRNLLQNAIKYASPARLPVIEIGGEMLTGCCRLWVRDNGIGFDMAYHDRIFEIFRRLHTYEEFPGSGIGLALVKKATERMGGRVWAESMPDEGTTFFLQLPA